jgi:hypothetical protein
LSSGRPVSSDIGPMMKMRFISGISAMAWHRARDPARTVAESGSGSQRIGPS